MAPPLLVKLAGSPAMIPLPSIPASAPFSAEQRLWLDGYFAGLFSQAEQSSAGTALPAAAPSVPLTILYGTQTGSAASLSKKIAAAAKKRAIDARVIDMAKHATVDLAREPNVLIITSTYGDGEMPDNAQTFWEILASDAAPPLKDTRFSVLALGDSNYTKFCQAGKDFDARLEALGATRLHPRTDCDVDYDEPAAAWMEAVLATLAAAPAATPFDEIEKEPAAPLWSKKKPYPAKLLTNRLLNTEGSGKEVRHFEIDLGDSGLTYEAGDALGIMPSNCPALVEECLALLGASGEEPCDELTLHAALLSRYDLLKPSPELLALAGLPDREGENLTSWLYGRDVADVIRECPAPPSTAALPKLLRKLQPRLYSISSSPKAHAGQVHLTVGAVRYDAHGRSRKGVCSTFLADRALTAGVPIYFHSSPGFRLPADGSRPVIMVGPGTGIAPFRAFLYERQATKATGGNWLFFGDQHAASDFYYREELEALQQTACLTHLDTAFSRDQATKIYVQNRMLERSAELHAWLEKGAHFYVCGDASRMAKDVDRALHQIYETVGHLSPEAAAAAISQLKAEGRYQRDVY
ncbi:MAG: sulfite reductase subunit alpha [Verrucomicrobiota bacterium]